MSERIETERDALANIAEKYAKEGYRVIQEPTGSDLPGFFEGYRPDLVALGRDPSVAVEVLRDRTDTSSSTLRGISSLFKNRKDWRFDLHYLPTFRPLVGSVEETQIADAVESAAKIADREPRGAFLLLWAALEAAVRLRIPEESGNTLSAFAMSDILVSYSYMDQDDAHMLRELGKVRNMLAHGEIDRTPTLRELKTISELIEKLLRVEQAVGIPA